MAKSMKKTFLLCIFCLLLLNLFSQPYDPAKINKQAVAFYDQALQKAEAGNYNEAINLLNQSINSDAKYVDAYIALASIYGKMKNYKNSTDIYQKAFPLDSNYTNEYKLPYSINLAGQGRFE